MAQMSFSRSLMEAKRRGRLTGRPEPYSLTGWQAGAKDRVAESRNVAAMNSLKQSQADWAAKLAEMKSQYQPMQYPTITMPDYSGALAAFSAQQKTNDDMYARLLFQAKYPNATVNEGPFEVIPAANPEGPGSLQPNRSSVPSVEPDSPAQFMGTSSGPVLNPAWVAYQNYLDSLRLFYEGDSSGVGTGESDAENNGSF